MDAHNSLALSLCLQAELAQFFLLEHAFQFLLSLAIGFPLFLDLLLSGLSFFFRFVLGTRLALIDSCLSAGISQSLAYANC